MTDSGATPTSMLETTAAIALIDLPRGLTPQGLADRLAFMPEEIGGLPRRSIQRGDDSATVIYITGEETSQPQFGMVVALIVPPSDDAEAAVAELQRTRWGDPDDHTVTARGAGDKSSPAYVEFWRAFPPGLFALPNQPIYFLLFYRAESEQAFMVIATNPAMRAALIEEMGTALRP